MGTLHTIGRCVRSLNLLFMCCGWCGALGLLQIPSDPKLLVSNYEPDKLSRFFLTSIEQQPRRELLLPADVGVTIRWGRQQQQQR
jgi:hypothetical protein